MEDLVKKLPERCRRCLWGLLLAIGIGGTLLIMLGGAGYLNSGAERPVPRAFTFETPEQRERARTLEHNAILSTLRAEMTILDAEQNQRLARQDERIIQAERRLQGIEDRLWWMFITLMGAGAAAVCSAFFSWRSHAMIQNGNGICRLPHQSREEEYRE